MLEALAAAAPTSGLTMSQCVARTGIPRASCHRLLQAMCEAGYAQRVGRGRFVPGWHLHLLGRSLGGRPDLLPLAHPFLEDLAGQTGLTAHLGVLDGLDVLYLDAAEGRSGLRVHARPGTRLPANMSALGLAIAANLPPDEHTRWPLERRPSPEELAAIRDHGYAVDEGRYAAELHCLAAPVRDGQGRVDAAIGIVGLTTQVRAARSQLVEAVTGAAQGLSARLSRG